MIKDIVSFAIENGINLPLDIPLDGKIHRFPIDKDDSKKSGWAVGFSNHTLKSGEHFEVMTFGNYRESVSFTYTTDKVTFTKEDKSHIKKQIEAAKSAAEAQRLQHQKDQAVVAETYWKSFNEEGNSPYLAKKQITEKNIGVRYDGTGNIYVPMRDTDGKLWSFQRIDWLGEKKFFWGGRVQGCFHTMGDIREHDIIRVTEGLATGASIYMATNETVICTFTASNLVEVTKELKRLYPEKSFIICGDEDKFKKNPKGEIPNVGRTKAEEAAKLSLGKAVFPVFKNEESKPTDFNDLHILEGIEAVKDQVKNVEVKKLALYALGFKEKEYFFTSTENRQVVPVTSFSERDLLDLMPIDYWEAVFPGKSDNARVDWTLAKSSLMVSCRKKGLFKGHNVRGAGVWVDDNRIVVNMGDHLVVDGQRLDLGAIRSRFFYSLGESFKKLNDVPLSTEECKILTDTCQKFKWTKNDSGILLAGILVLSRVCGALPVRPHCWITGGAQTGKSTLLENLIQKIIGSSGLYVQGGTTEAGVRQHLKSDAVPVLFDEFETNGRKSDDNIAALIELMRASWSDSSAHIVKGGATGNASHFQVRFSAIVSSIRTKLINDADKGRFTVLELAPHGSDAAHWRQLSALLSQIDEEYAERLFARVIKLIPVMLQNYRVIKKCLAIKADSRFGDQYGMILAGYSILIHDQVIDKEEAEFLCENVELEEEKEVSKQADHDDAMTYFMTTTMTYETAGGRREVTIGEMITTLLKEDNTGMKEALLNIGVRVESSYVSVVASGHSTLEDKVWKGTKWSQAWGIIKRIPGSERKKMKFIGKPYWAILIPSSYFLA